MLLHMLIETGLALVISFEFRDWLYTGNKASMGAAVFHFLILLIILSHNDK